MDLMGITNTGITMGWVVAVRGNHPTLFTLNCMIHCSSILYTGSTA